MSKCYQLNMNVNVVNEIVYYNRLYNEQRKKFPKLPSQMCIRIYKALLSNYKT